MNIQTTIEGAPARTAPYKVDTSRGTTDGTVSQQWMSRPRDQKFLDLVALRDKVRSRYENSFETRAQSAEVNVLAPEITRPEDMHRLSIGVTINTPTVQRVAEVTPTHWAFGQLCSLAKAPAKFLRELPSPLVSDTMNWRFRYAREVEEIKLYGGDDELYAATGPDYGRIPDHQVVDAVMQVAGTGRGEARWKVPGMLNWRNGTYDPEHPVTLDTTTIFGSDRDVFIFLVDDRNPIEVGKLPDGSPDYVFRGFYVQNSEVGSRSLKLAAFLLRGVCMNRMLWGVEQMQEITIRHTRLAPDRWLQQCVPALNSYADGSQQRLIDGVEQAKAAVLVNSDDKAMEFLKTRNFSAANAKAILQTGLEEEGRPVRSAWDFGQAISAFARTIPNTDDRLAVELEAGKVLNKATGVRPMAELVVA